MRRVPDKMTAVLAPFLAFVVSCGVPDQMAAQFETIPSGEAEAIAETVTITAELQNRRAEAVPEQEGQILRGVHAKSHGCVRAEFSVDADIPEDYQLGLFAEPGRRYDAWIRFSNAAVLRSDDLEPSDQGRRNGSRGMALKIINVDGEMLESDGGVSNQDFLMINTPEFAFANVRDYLRLNRILTLSEQGDDGKAYFLPAAVLDPNLPETQRTEFQSIIEKHPFLQELEPEDIQGTVQSAQVLGKIQSQTVRHPMQVAYFGAAPFKFGDDRAMKVSAKPCEIVEQDPFEEVTAQNPSPNYLRDALSSTMRGTTAICYSFQIQTRTQDDPALGIENATTMWPDELDQYASVAQIEIPAPQDTDSDVARAECEALAFNPWHALSVHQPIGGINRLRRPVYATSATTRGASGY